MVKSELRSLLVGGNVFCLRAGDKVTGNMLNIQANPWELPKLFPNGLETFGLGYCDTVEQRLSTPFRADWVEDPELVAETAKIAPLDDRAAAKMAEIIAQEDATAEQLSRAADAATLLQLKILARLGQPATQGALVVGLRGEATLTEVAEAISILESDGKVTRKGDMIEATK
jgi:hypothetical protein